MDVEVEADTSAVQGAAKYVEMVALVVVGNF